MAKKNSGCCYWCGLEPVDREHVPPLNIFPKLKRNNLITVPACEAHNKQLSRVDERMRFYLQAGSSTSEAFSEFKNTVSALERPEAAGLAAGIIGRIMPTSMPGKVGAEIVGVSDDLVMYFEKITRGLAYHHQKKPFGGTCVAAPKQSFITSPEILEFHRTICPYFQIDGFSIDGVAANPDIFKYRYISKSNGDLQMFVVDMFFYNDIEVISALTKPA